MHGVGMRIIIFKTVNNNINNYKYSTFQKPGHSLFRSTIYKPTFRNPHLLQFSSIRSILSILSDFITYVIMHITL